MINKEEDRGIVKDWFKKIVQKQMPDFAKMLGWSSK
jgi:hypothetical protein